MGARRSASAESCSETNYERLSREVQARLELGKHSTLACEEKRVRFCISECINYQTAQFKVDGGLIPKSAHGEKKCDDLFLIYDEEQREAQVFVELKTSKYHDALRQVEATLSHDLFADMPRPYRRAIRIVMPSYPGYQNDPKAERLREYLAKQYKCSVKRIKSNEPQKASSFFATNNQ